MMMITDFSKVTRIPSSNITFGFLPLTSQITISSEYKFLTMSATMIPTASDSLTRRGLNPIGFKASAIIW